MGLLDSLGSLFGGHHTSAQAQGDWDTARRYLGGVGGAATTFGALGDNALTTYNGDNTAARTAEDQYADYLRTDPYTDQYSASVLNQATSGSAAGNLRAKSNLSADAARRGVTDSSIVGGGLTAADNAQAGQLAGAQNALAMQKIQARQGRLQGLAGLLRGRAGQDYAQGVGALGQSASLGGSLAGDYLNIGNEEQQRQDQQDNQLLQLLTGAAGAYGASRGVSRPRPAASTGDPRDDFYSQINL